MITFKRLFGQEEHDIKPLCVLVPFLRKELLRDLGIGSWHAGNPYASGNSRDLTLVLTRPGAGWLGDAVLGLKPSPCRDIVLFGACGLTANTAGPGIGGLVAPATGHALDSFSALLSGEENFPRFPARSSLRKELLALSRKIHPVGNCASLASVLLEPRYKDYFAERKITALDMETAALFQAARRIRRNGAALLVVTDLLDQSHPYRTWTARDKTAITTAFRTGAALLRELGARRNGRDKADAA
jgi:hypothetical protein